MKQRLRPHLSPQLRCGLSHLAAWGVAAAVLQLAAAAPGFIEHYYSRGFYMAVSPVLRLISGLFPFSLQEGIYTVFFLYLFFQVLQHLHHISPERRPWRLKLCRLSRFLLGTLLWFYLTWGCNYFRQPLPVQCGWARVTRTGQLQKLESLLPVITAQLNHLNARDLPADTAALDRELDNCYRRTAAALGLHLPSGTTKTKRLLWDFLQTGPFTGVTLPFLQEAHLAQDLLPWEIPFVAAHEKAHLYGYALESEANFLGWYAASLSKWEGIRYSAHAALLRYLLGSLPPARRRVWSSRLTPQVLARYRQAARRSKRRPQLLRAINTMLYDSYLRSQRIKSGVQNYNRVTSLVLRLPLLPATLRQSNSPAPPPCRSGHSTPPRSHHPETCEKRSNATPGCPYAAVRHTAPWRHLPTHPGR